MCSILVLSTARQFLRLRDCSRNRLIGMYHSVKQFVVNHPWERLILSITYLNYRIIFPCNIFLFWILYSILVWVYAGIIFALDDLGDDSIYNAFELSWTTMSTVGYGTVAVSVESSHMFSRILLAIEALVGILYVGLSGAMIITKVSCTYSSLFGWNLTCLCEFLVTIAF